MPEGLEISLAPERLDDGPAEERACFGQFSIRAGAIELTAGLDSYISSYRLGPLVSGYHAAEWFAWNWWRLRYEPHSSAEDWWRSHKMTAIGEGYSWPIVTIFSDGVRTTLLSRPSARPDAKPFRYFGAIPVVVPSVQFEAAVDVFIARILGRLREREVAETNLNRIWNDVLAERADGNLARRRHLEALLGRSADEVEDDSIDRLVEDSKTLGEGAVEELAAQYAVVGNLMTAESLNQIARHHGVNASPKDAVQLSPGTQLPAATTSPAWRLGSEAAHALRSQLGLGEEAISNKKLAEMAGVDARALKAPRSGLQMSFALDDSGTSGHVLFRTDRETGRRFELARLLGDRVVNPRGGRLHPATRAYTYRQKMQRSFAGEFLSPFEAVDAMLAGDYSAEAQVDAAECFQVSSRTIWTLLVNHGRIERGEFDEDVDVAA